MRSIISNSIRFRMLFAVLAAAMLFFGVTQFRTMPVDVLPEFSSPYVEVQTEALGLSASEVEQFITVPLEANLLSGVAWLDVIHSESVPGLSSITLVFEPGTDLLEARQMVQERLIQAHALPRVSKPPTMLQPLSSTNRLMMVSLSSDDLSLIDMSVLARWTVRPRLMGVAGVANVAVWGQRERQLQVQVDPAELRAQGVTLEQVISTTGNALWVSPLSFLNASTPGTGGFIDTPNQRIGIRHVLPITTPEDLARVPVEGADLQLGDIARVVEDHQPLIGDAIVNDGEGLMLVVEKFPDANTLAVTSDVEEALEALAPGLEGIEIDATVYRPATYIEAAIGNTSIAIILSLILVALVLLAFLLDLRSLAISLIAIPVSMAAATFVLYLQGATVNAMVIAGLVLALVVVIDEAVIDVQHIVRRLREQRLAGTARPTAEVVLAAASEMRGPGVYAITIILLALTPVAFMDGLYGAFLPPVVISFGLAVLAAMVVALTLTPALAVILFSRGRVDRGEPAVARRLKHGYDALLGRIATRPRPAYLAFGIVGALGIGLLPLMPQEPMPTFRELDLLIHWEGTPGTSRPEMTRIVAQAGRELRSIVGVRNVGGHVGRAVLSDQVVGISSAELWVSVDPAANYDATVADIEEMIEGYPGLDPELISYPAERVRAILPEDDDELAVRIYGHDAAILLPKAAEVGAALDAIDGLSNPRIDRAVEEPTVEIEVDLARAQGYGITPGDVRRAAAAILSGLEVGNLFEDQKVFEVVVVGVPDVRHSLDNIATLLIDTPDGAQVALGDVAAVRITSAPSTIRREGITRYVDVLATTNGRDLNAIVSDVEERLATIPFPMEYHPEVMGAHDPEGLGNERFLGAAAAVVIGILLLLQAAFGSWRLAIATLLGLPVAVAGGVVAAFLTGGILSMGVILGLLAVFAITVRHAVTLVRSYLLLQSQGEEVFGTVLAARGAQERLMPILTASVATAIAFAPFVVLGGRPGMEIVQPMAVVVMGGLVTSVLVNIFAMPVLYLRFGTQPETVTVAIPIEQVKERQGVGAN